MSTPVASTTDLSGPRLGLNSKEPLNLVKNMPGYTTPVFRGKEEQRALVEQEVAAKVPIIRHRERVLGTDRFLRVSFLVNSLLGKSIGSTRTSVSMIPTSRMNRARSSRTILLPSLALRLWPSRNATLQPSLSTLRGLMSAETARPSFTLVLRVLRQPKDLVPLVRLGQSWCSSWLSFFVLRSRSVVLAGLVLMTCITVLPASCLWSTMHICDVVGLFHRVLISCYFPVA